MLWADSVEAPAERAAAYRHVVDVVERSAGRWPEWYLLVCRAWALCHLTLVDEEASVDEALAAVHDSIRAGGACFPVLTAAGMLYVKRRDEELLRVVRALPRGCFRGERFIWRFRIWSLRAASALRLGRSAEARLYAQRVIDAMIRAKPEDELDWESPLALVDELLSRRDADHVVLLEQMAVVDLDRWFGEERAFRIRAAIGSA